MNTRERFERVCNFEPVDHPPRWECFGFLDSTVERWEHEGLPLGVSPEEHFDMETWTMIPIETGLTSGSPFSEFDHRAIGRDERSVIFIGSEASRRIPREETEMPMSQLLGHPMANRDDWDSIKWRLDGGSPDRYPDWEKIRWKYAGRDFVAGMNISGLYFFIQNLFGDRQLAYLQLEDPDFLKEMLLHWIGFNRGIATRVLSNLDVDYISVWEDLVLRDGTTVDRQTFETFYLPYYKLLMDSLHSLGVRNLMLHAYGNNSSLMDYFVELNFNVFFPLDVSAGMNPLELRERYGRKLVLWSGLDSRVLLGEKSDIERELKNKVPQLMDGGGYIPAIDHPITPDVPFENYKYYVELLRELVGS